MTLNPTERRRPPWTGGAVSDYFDDIPADRFDVCEERSRQSERCEYEADHSGPHSFQLDCPACEARREEDECHGRPLFSKPIECSTCGGTHR